VQSTIVQRTPDPGPYSIYNTQLLFLRKLSEEKLRKPDSRCFSGTSEKLQNNICSAIKSSELLQGNWPQIAINL